MAFIGAGVIILCVVWAIAIVVCVLLMQCGGTVAYLRVVVLTLALLLTVALWIKFKRDQESKVDDVVIYDYSIVGRAVILALTGTALLVGLFSIFTFHVTVDQRASRIPPWHSELLR